MPKDSKPGIDSLSIVENETILQRLMKSMCIGERASDLPEGIIHHILSFLSTEDAAKASLLSKTWLQAWSTRPSLYFRQSWFCSNDRDVFGRILYRDMHEISKHDEKKFIDSVDSTLQRQSRHNLPIHRFELDLTLIDSKLDNWIEMVVEKGVEELVLSIYKSMSTTSYTLPEIIFEAKQLVVLKVCGFGFLPKENEEMASFRLERQVFSETDVECHKLKSVLLHSVYIDDFTFMCLTSNCLLLEELGICLCDGLNKIQVLGLPRLKKLYLAPIHRQKVYIDETLSLERFLYDDGYCKSNNCFKPVALLAYHGLKYLSLFKCKDLSDMLLSMLISGLPSLENLRLLYCKLLKVICVSSLSLKEFTLVKCMNVIDVKINAPSLHSLVYDGDTIPSMFLPCTQGQLKSSIFHVHLSGDIDTSFLVKIRGLPTQFSRSQIFLLIHSRNISFSTDDLNEVQVLHPKPRIGKLFLPPDMFSLTYPMLLDGLLWSCCPESLNLIWADEKSAEFMTFLYKELIEENRSRNCCSSSNQIKCWRHYLNHASVSYYDEVRWKWILLGPLDLKFFADGSLNLKYRFLIRFSLSWS